MTTTITVERLAPADTETRFKAAMKDAKRRAKAAGLDMRARINVPGCCRGCIGNEALSLTDETVKTLPYVFHFGGQGNRIQWCKGVPLTEVKESRYHYGKRGRVETEVYFNHANGGGTFLAAAMVDAGFEVEWDGTEHKTVIVKFPTPIVNHVLWTTTSIGGQAHWAEMSHKVRSLAGSDSEHPTRFTVPGPPDIKDLDPAVVEAAAVKALTEKHILETA